MWLYYDKEPTSWGEWSSPPLPVSELEVVQCCSKMLIHHSLTCQHHHFKSTIDIASHHCLLLWIMFQNKGAALLNWPVISVLRFYQSWSFFSFCLLGQLVHWETLVNAISALMCRPPTNLGPGLEQPSALFSDWQSPRWRSPSVPSAPWTTCSSFSFSLLSPSLPLPVFAHIFSDHLCLHLFCISLHLPLLLDSESGTYPERRSSLPPLFLALLHHD